MVCCMTQVNVKGHEGLKIVKMADFKVNLHCHYSCSQKTKFNYNGGLQYRPIPISVACH